MSFTASINVEQHYKYKVDETNKLFPPLATMVLLSENDLFILQEVLLVLKGITFPVELFSPGIAESISIAALLFDK